MSTDWIVIALICGSVPAATLFPIIFGFTRPWWRTLIGRALLVKSVAVAMLIDLSLLVRVIGINEFWADVLRVLIFSLIFAGVNMQTGALLIEMYRRPHPLRDRKDDAAGTTFEERT